MGKLLFIVRGSLNVCVTVTDWKLHQNLVNRKQMKWKNNKNQEAYKHYQEDDEEK